ncbi:MAG: FAD-dependent oxidoreductase [Candidatus Omnitrophica bacterium]|nr:FAD-dependent oxidoreductase [Candidatus Omnitrophota bacterium]
MKVVIIGGVAGGASCAARLRRLLEDAEIVMVEKGEHVSFANCGLPYYVGNVIKEDKDLLVATPALFKKRFNIDVRVRTEAVAIDRSSKTVRMRDLVSGSEYDEAYDKLVLATGAAPLKPPLPGIETEGIFTLKYVTDSQKIRQWIETKNVRKAVIVGGGFIGLEMAESLTGAGIQVSVIEMLNQVMPPVDFEMAEPVHEHLRVKGVELVLGDGVQGFEKTANGVAVTTKGGKKIEAELVLLSIGVRAESRLAEAAGLKLGERKGIWTNEQMQTSDSEIYAVGDAAEIKDAISGTQAMVPLAGPANRQGRVAADAIAGKKTVFRGVQATAICKVFDLAVAMTGESEKSLKRMQMPYEKVYLHPTDHASYYPGAHTLHLKVLFSPDDGRLLGAQAVGAGGADKRIDVIAMAIQKKGTVYDLEEAELCYAPQFGSAKDAVNMAGMIAVNALRGDAPIYHWDRQLETPQEDTILLDVRSFSEYQKAHAPGAVNIPLDELRGRINELSTSSEIHVYCGVGQRAHNAVRILRAHGLNALNLSGGFQTYNAYRSANMKGSSNG